MKIYSKGAAIPAPSSKKEVQEDCLSCGESIVHPLCPCCVSKGFRQWVKNLPEKESKKILKRLNRFHKDHIYYDGKSKRCVSCNEFKTYLCPYCFTSFLHEVLKIYGVPIFLSRQYITIIHSWKLFISNSFHKM